MQQSSFIFAIATLILAACNGSPSVSENPGTKQPSGDPTAATGATAIISDLDIWHPALRTSWQWQLTDLPVDQSFDVDMYDIDLFENDASVVAALHASGRRVICYMNAGGWEDWRPDAGQFPEVVLGKNLDGWPGEKWLDIRKIDQLAPILEARLDVCKEKGFDGVEPDNVDGYLNDTGFPLNYADQLRFNLWLSAEAHERGLSIGLKNDVEQIPDLVEHFDWALNEECFAYDECETLLPFIAAGKAVFHVEYEFDPSEFCEPVNALNFNSMKKNWDLDAWQDTCW
jgi:hypothetical protein